MPMMRTFRYPLSPTVAQAAVLEQWRVACQQLYNGALQERRDAWQKARVNIGYNDQTKSLTELRRDDPEWAVIPSNVERSALSRIDKSFKAFFRRVKSGDTPGFPRFKSRDRYGSIGLGRTKVSDGLVHVPKLGAVRFHQYREMKGVVKSVEVTRNAKGWYVCVACDLGTAPPKLEPATSVGIDLGLTSLVIPVAYGCMLAESHHDSSKREAHYWARPEPSFTLLARDPLAPIVVELWASMREHVAGNPSQVTAARECATKMRQWLIASRASKAKP